MRSRRSLLRQIRHRANKPLRLRLNRSGASTRQMRLPWHCLKNPWAKRSALSLLGRRCVDTATAVDREAHTGDEVVFDQRDHGVGHVLRAALSFH